MAAPAPSRHVGPNPLLVLDTAVLITDRQKRDSNHFLFGELCAVLKGYNRSSTPFGISKIITKFIETWLEGMDSKFYQRFLKYSMVVSGYCSQEIYFERQRKWMIHCLQLRYMITTLEVLEVPTGIWSRFKDLSHVYITDEDIYGDMTMDLRAGLKPISDWLFDQLVGPDQAEEFILMSAGVPRRLNEEIEKYSAGSLKLFAGMGLAADIAAVPYFHNERWIDEAADCQKILTAMIHKCSPSEYLANFTAEWHAAHNTLLKEMIMVEM